MACERFENNNATLPVCENHLANPNAATVITRFAPAPTPRRSPLPLVIAGLSIAALAAAIILGLVTHMWWITWAILGGGALVGAIIGIRTVWGQRFQPGSFAGRLPRRGPGGWLLALVGICVAIFVIAYAMAPSSKNSTGTKIQPINASEMACPGTAGRVIDYSQRDDQEVIVPAIQGNCFGPMYKFPKSWRHLDFRTQANDPMGKLTVWPEIWRTPSPEYQTDGPGDLNGTGRNMRFRINRTIVVSNR